MTSLENKVLVSRTNVNDNNILEKEIKDAAPNRLNLGHSKSIPENIFIYLFKIKIKNRINKILQKAINFLYLLSVLFLIEIPQFHKHNIIFGNQKNNHHK